MLYSVQSEVWQASLIIEERQVKTMFYLFMWMYFKLYILSIFYAQDVLSEKGCYVMSPIQTFKETFSPKVGQ